MWVETRSAPDTIYPIMLNLPAVFINLIVNNNKSAENKNKRE